MGNIDALMTVITIGSVKTPRQVQDLSGLGNDDFDAGKKKSKFGYPISSSFSLPYPLSSSALTLDHDCSTPHRFTPCPISLIHCFPRETWLPIFESPGR